MLLLVALYISFVWNLSTNFRWVEEWSNFYLDLLTQFVFPFFSSSRFPKIIRFRGLRLVHMLRWAAIAVPKLWYFCVLPVTEYIKVSIVTFLSPESVPLDPFFIASTHSMQQAACLLVLLTGFPYFQDWPLF